MPHAWKRNSNLTSYEELSINGLFKNKDKASLFTVIKSDINEFISADKKDEEHTTKL